MSIKISIIIPAYNVEKYIKTSILSAVNQTLKAIEIIVVNDGSTDNTLDIIKKLRIQDERIIVVDKENGGLSSARNAGIRVATGEYIQHLDGDDWIEQNSCQELYDFAKKNKLDMVLTDIISDNGQGSLNIIHDETIQDTILNGEEYLYYLFKGYSQVSVCSKLIKRNLYRNIEHPENISLGEDLATTPRLALQADRIAKFNDAFLHYMENLESITRDKFSVKMYQVFIAFDIIRDTFERENKLTQYEELIAELEVLRINSFLVMRPYWKDENYMKSMDLILQFIKEFYVIPERIKGVKRILLTYLLRYPTKNNLRYVIRLSNFLSKIKDGV